MVKIQVKRGEKASLPELSEGEFGLTTDTKEIYIGTQNGNMLLLTSAQGIVNKFSNKTSAIQIGNGTHVDNSLVDIINTVIQGNGHTLGNDSPGKYPMKCLHVEGENNAVFGDYSHAEGANNRVSNTAAHVEGENNTASGQCSHAGGFNNKAVGYAQTVIGKNSENESGPTSSTDAGGSIFVIGGGSEEAKKNAFRVTTAGACYGQSTFNASGADYAEYFEWIDGNPDDEDRRGLFVTLDGEKIRLATSDDDFILGIVSAVPLILGDAHEQWHRMYAKDVFGKIVTETVEVPETMDKYGKVIPAHTEVREIINSEYDSDNLYISRENRPEWDAVGLIGKLVVVDDGSCQVNGYCKPADGGVATVSEKRTSYRVLSRVDDTHVKVLILQG